MKNSLYIINEYGNMNFICNYETSRFYETTLLTYFYDMDENVICRLSANTNFYIQYN